MFYVSCIRTNGVVLGPKKVSKVEGICYYIDRTIICSLIELHLFTRVPQHKTITTTTTMDGESFASGFYNVSTRFLQMSTDDSTIVDQCFVSVLDEDDDLSTNDSTNLTYACPYIISSITLQSLDTSQHNTRTNEGKGYNSRELHRMNDHKSIHNRQNLNSALDHNDYLNEKLNFELKLNLRAPRKPIRQISMTSELERNSSFHKKETTPLNLNIVVEPLKIRPSIPRPKKRNTTENTNPKIIAEPLKIKPSIPRPKKRNTTAGKTKEKTKKMIPLQRTEKPLSDSDEDESERNKDECILFRALYRRAN